ncbi:hypothetical protein DVH24_039310 [Malus domestica]|uniref:Uncharacterized protein n=1 Tax=Malus domestica TaxID=3750 RepID=A0A498I2E7_MALDO|nr:hypothetical protein DVH24_039310 [Malus domestica]
MATLVADKEAEIATLATQLATQVTINNLTHQVINAIFLEKIREFQMSLTTPILGYWKPYPAHYDTVPFP